MATVNPFPAEVRVKTPNSGLVRALTFSGDSGWSADRPEDARFPASFRFLGDYEGLDNFGSTFTPFFVQANGTHATPLTDAFYSTAGP